MRWIDMATFFWGLFFLGVEKIPVGGQAVIEGVLMRGPRRWGLAVRRPEGGWGALITFLPKEGETRSPGIYDRLEFCKGPSLGTVFTLACPFMLLAHYTELEWAESCGVPRSLIRLSVGLEDPEDLWRRLERALTAR